MNRDERIKLKPCPFCGKQPTYQQGVTLKQNQLPQWNVYCSLDANDPCPLARKPFSIEEWNTRDREAVLVAALEQLRDCDWVITLPDRMDAVRKIAREALEQYRGER